MKEIIIPSIDYTLLVINFIAKIHIYFFPGPLVNDERFEERKYLLTSVANISQHLFSFK